MKRPLFFFLTSHAYVALRTANSNSMVPYYNSSLLQLKALAGLIKCEHARSPTAQVNHTVNDVLTVPSRNLKTTDHAIYQTQP
ncbi:hypothetical protein F5Y19DRAFT_434789 [Xylariaceae sp. FL1651]|nr:hypothetical protein F5Y19DRAFT_434789 [Xylariaceae sp. FL1651]